MYVYLSNCQSSTSCFERGRPHTSPSTFLSGFPNATNFDSFAPSWSSVTPQFSNFFSVQRAIETVNFALSLAAHCPESSLLVQLGSYSENLFLNHLTTLQSLKIYVLPLKDCPTCFDSRSIKLQIILSSLRHHLWCLTFSIQIFITVFRRPP